MSRVLVPIDYSEHSRDALRWAYAFTREWKARITLLRVKEKLHGVEPLPGGVLDKLEQHESRAEKESMSRFAQAVLAKDDVGEIVMEVRFGTPRQEINRFAKKESITYIIMGTRGRHTFFEKLLGTVSSKVMQNSPCPVILIPAGTRFGEINQIALASDLFLSEEESYTRLQQLAETFKAEIHRLFINVMEGNALSRKEEVFYTSAESVGAGFPARITMVRDSSIMDGISYFVSHHNIDLLAIYVPHRDQLSRIFHRSVSKRLLFETMIPLLIFREDQCF